SWSQPRLLNVFPRLDDVVSIVPIDLLGNGTSCLVWSSPLPGDARRPMRYVNLMGKDKPHLLVKTINNLGAETRVDYAPSTKFHTGVYLGRDHVSDYLAGLLNSTDQGEYFREPGLTDAAARDLLLPDTVLPAGLTLEEEREACRALKGSMLRQEVYADDAGPGASAEDILRARVPYTVTERNFGVRALQPRGTNRHAVFFTDPAEAISCHYEPNPAD